MLESVAAVDFASQGDIGSGVGVEAVDVVEAVKLIASPERIPTLFHCDGNGMEYFGIVAL